MQLIRVVANLCIDPDIGAVLARKGETARAHAGV